MKLFSVGLSDGRQPSLSFRPGHQQTPELLQELQSCWVKGDGDQILGGVVWKGLETQDQVRARHLMPLCTSIPAEGVRAIWKDGEGQGFPSLKPVLPGAWLSPSLVLAPQDHGPSQQLFF